ncbi:MULTISPECIES: tetraacyldisaccharide 4'-kinase [Thalassospira]|uniref:Tetraacyldisaccharide 4'-kinase n=2 Tax=Thalassospira TaxID=168934 RepID=A0A367W2H4_9PROT|nr:MULTISPECIES: tetraacyldisaccharide 4'-kinase [Thalassospira]MDG4718447.1 tetraacyldisaccharide 4'-kinase [Thalassospira sp. FZY0004]RCK34638.1 tetraacyldisaccharide 4'-kinase [Thalassospira profundimaris]
MRDPQFWKEDGLVPKLLSPASLLWRAGACIRTKTTTPRHPGCPVFCVGNFTVGGAGKTPTAVTLFDLLTAMGRNPHFVSRGYGGSITGPHRVDPSRDTASQVGDEPLLLAQHGPAWISRERFLGAEMARDAGADAIILDDGLQNPSIIKDCSFAVIDSNYGIGNGRVMPAGPMREPLISGLAKVRAIILIGDATPSFITNLPASVPVLRAHIAPVNGTDFAGKKVMAFAGIGRPQKFYDTLASVGAEIVATQDFDDHHAFNADELSALQIKSAGLGAQLVTTQKDLMRLPSGSRSGINSLDIRLAFDAPDQLAQIVKTVLADG